MEYEALTQEDQVIYESHFSMILDEVEKVLKNGGKKTKLDLLEIGCIAVLKMMHAQRDLRLARMEVSRALRGR